MTGKMPLVFAGGGEKLEKVSSSPAASGYRGDWISVVVSFLWTSIGFAANSV